MSVASSSTSTYPPRSNGSTAPVVNGNGNHYDDDDLDIDDARSASIPEFVDLTIVLPNGEMKVITVEYIKAMQDILVQVALAHRLSPTRFKFHIMDNETERQVEIKASQQAGTLPPHVTLHLVDKNARLNHQTPVISTETEKTQRLVVQLPGNRSVIQRVSPEASLATIFAHVTKAKGLDPYSHEFRHPSQPDTPLVMTAPLKHYKLSEIELVHIGGGGNSSYSPPPPSSRHDSSDGKANLSTSSASINSSSDQSYMPGMSTMKKKKKNSFLKLFSRGSKKEGKFKPVVEQAQQQHHSQPSQPQYHNHHHAPPPPAPANNRHSMFVPGPTPLSAELKEDRTLHSSNPSLLSSGAESSTTKEQAAAAPAKPVRKNKKRPAPPPPVAAATGSAQPLSTTKTAAASSDLSVDTNTTTAAAAASTDPTSVHSRTSSHSSGFESSVSPLESPSSTVVRGEKKEEVRAAAPAATKAKGKKKRAAPAPPGGGSRPASTVPAAVGMTTPGSPAPSTLSGQSDVSEFQPVAASSPTERKEEQTEEKPKMIEEDLSAEGPAPSSRPCQFIAPPPPDTPPPTEETVERLETGEKSTAEGVDTCTQVTVSVRDSLTSVAHSRTSSISSYEETADDNEETDDLDTEEAKKSDITQFVERMTSLTENVENPLPPTEEKSYEEDTEEEVKVKYSFEEEVASPHADDPVLLSSKKSSPAALEGVALFESHDSGFGTESKNNGDLEATLAATVDHVQKRPTTTEEVMTVNRFEPVSISEEISFENFQDVQYVEPEEKAAVERKTKTKVDLVADPISPPTGFGDEVQEFPAPKVVPVPKMAEVNAEEDSQSDASRVLEEDDLSSVDSVPILKEAKKEEVISIAQKKEEVISIAQKKEEVISIAPKKEEPKKQEVISVAPKTVEPQKKEVLEHTPKTMERSRREVMESAPKKEDSKKEEANWGNSLRDMYKKQASPRTSVNYQFTVEDKPKKNPEDLYVFTVPKDQSTNPYGMTIPGVSKVFKAKPIEVQPTRPKATVTAQKNQAVENLVQHETVVRQKSVEKPQEIKEEESKPDVVDASPVPKHEPETIVITKKDPEEERRKIEAEEKLEKIVESLKKEEEKEPEKDKCFWVDIEPVKKPESPPPPFTQHSTKTQSPITQKKSPEMESSRLGVTGGKHMRHFELDRRHSYNTRDTDPSPYSSQTLPARSSHSKAAGPTPYSTSNMALYSARGWGASNKTLAASDVQVRDVRSTLAASPEQARQEMSKMKFSPDSAYEQDSILEDKSIMQMAMPVQRKSILKNTRQPTVGGGGHYGSAMTLSSDSLSSSSERNGHGATSAMVNSTDNLMSGAAQQQNVSTIDRERRNKTLQAQYSDLKSQFSRWQEKLAANDEVLQQRNITPTTSSSSSLSYTQHPPQRSTSLSNPSVDKSDTLQKPVSLRKVEPASSNLRKAKSIHTVYSPRESLLEELRQKTPMVEAAATDETVSARISPPNTQSKNFEPIISKRQSFTRRSASSSSSSMDQELPLPREGSPTSSSRPPPTFRASSSMVESSIVPPPPPAPPAPALQLPQKSAPLRSFSAPSAGHKPRFEPVLDPREELMMAIRNSSGGKNLRKTKPSEADC